MDKEKETRRNLAQEKVTYLGGDPEEKAKADKALREICSDGDVTYEVTIGEVVKAAERYNISIDRGDNSKDTCETTRVKNEIENVSMEHTLEESEKEGSSIVVGNGDKNDKEENEDDTQTKKETDTIPASTTVEITKLSESETGEDNSNSCDNDENHSTDRNSPSEKNSFNLPLGPSGRSAFETSEESEVEVANKNGKTCNDDDVQSTDRDSSTEEKSFTSSTGVEGKPDSAIFEVPEILTPEGFVIKLYLQDLLETDVDVIVNAANDKMLHGAGIAAAISRRAGPDMKKECKDYIQKYGSLPVSKAFVSGAGQLKFKNIIHVVGPSWTDYNNKLECLKDLAKTVTNLLEKAKECKTKAVAMPTISSGIFRVPKSLCAAMYLKGVFDFSKQKKFGSLKEIHIVDLSLDVLDLIKEKYQHYLTFKKAIDPAWLVVRYHSEGETKASRGNTASTQASKLSEKTKDDLNREQAPLSKSKENKNSEHSMKTTKIGNVCVYIYTGDLGLLSDLDVAVSSENPHFTGKGGIAANFLSKGGKKYKEEHEKLQKGAPYPLYSILTTLGYDTKFKKICHAIIVAFSKTNPLLLHHHMQYKNFIFGILNQVNNLAGQSCGRKKKSLRSIVMPLLGAGNLHDPHTIQTLCTLTRDAIEWYARFKPSHITQIHLVNMRDEFTKMLVTTSQQTGLKLPIPEGNAAKSSKFDSRSFQYIYNWKVPSKDKTVSLADFIRQSENTKGNTCIICMDEMTQPVEFARCRHQFCEECITEYFSSKPICPVCNTVYGKLYGIQPVNGEARIFKDKKSLPGFPKTETFIISYVFPDGKQEDCHPDPGRPYSGIQRQAYLPDNNEGREVLHLLEAAFKQRLVFTIGVSRTTGREGVVTWNDIHHKTRRDGGPESFGYPDEEYLARVKEELNSKGITNE
ncbi:uncharacterized protein LOC133202498 [Saccostrea echinata]|uniref:uncharacterized protein LOC133202498 n=1 Tax=Saccostrea echinata TaxID=191078 RepID=UPI002A804BE9|nr:uncharacterized protein LOC133202498 [Saccostrea echinata]